jgi:hypothetical protein
MKKLALSIILAVGAMAVDAGDLDTDFFRSVDPLGPRDEWDLLHQSKDVNSTDFESRYRWRWVYYLKAPEQLVAQPAYVGALQRDLARLGYYCGPIDGVFSNEVGDSIARLQKSYSMRVTGTLTDSVRRALHLP